MGISRIDEDLCNGCSLCAEICPMDVIRMNKETSKAYIAYAIDCTTCIQCEEVCPTKAIYVSPEATRLTVLPY